MERNLSNRRTAIVTIGIMFGLFMASMEATVVATAMPTIVGQLGGLEVYSWVFSAYMLTSTITVPVFGKLSDLYGRRPVYMVAMGLFLGGSMLSGQANTMTQLILFRALQGLGAGGLGPLAFTMIGDMFTFAQRARMQGVFSSVWGLSSILGPLLGGVLVDQFSWRWVFYVNILPGLLAATVIWLAWQDSARETAGAKVQVDYAGVALLSASVVALLLGLTVVGTTAGWLLLALAAVLAVALVMVERRAADPLLPLSLFGNPLFSAACAHGLLAGAAMFGAISFVPLFGQAVLGASATAAGALITPLMIGWVTASAVGSRLLLRLGYRTLVVVGMVSLTAGAFFMTRVHAGTSQVLLVAFLAMMGIGMGASVPAFLIAVQAAVRRRVLGAATSTLQFSRTMGGTIGVSIMGVVLSLSLAANLTAAGLDAGTVDMNALLNPVAMETGVAAPVLSGAAAAALAGAVRNVFVVSLVAALLALSVSLLAPKAHVADLEARRKAAEADDAARGPVLPQPHRRVPAEQPHQ